MIYSILTESNDSDIDDESVLSRTGKEKAQFSKHILQLFEVLTFQKMDCPF